MFGSRIGNWKKERDWRRTRGNVGSDLTMERRKKKSPNLWKVAEKVAEKDPLPPRMK